MRAISGPERAKRVRHLIPAALRLCRWAMPLALSIASFGQVQSPPQSARELIDTVAANELKDRQLERKWIYVIQKREGNQINTEQQIDSKDGPIYRLLAIDGKPLSDYQRRQDEARVDRLLHDPSQQLRLKQAHEEDEMKLEQLMRVMPNAFLCDYDGFEGELIKVKFRPNPDYVPPTYEARVVHNLVGTILIDPRQKRLVKMSGKLVGRVDFGYGFLGHIDEGGTVEFGRVEVGAMQWKTALINVQLSGRIILFKTVNKQQYETRSEFRLVPGNLSLADAYALLVPVPIS